MALKVTGVVRSAAAAVAALAAPALAEARRRAKDGTDGREGRNGGGGRDRQDDGGNDDGGDGHHHGRGLWRRVDSGDGGTAHASANGGTITVGSAAYDDSDGDAAAQADDGGDDLGSPDAGDGVIEAAAKGGGGGGYDYGGRLGNLADNWRHIQNKRFGDLAGGNNGDGGNDQPTTGTNIQIDPDTGAIDYDNGNVAFIRDADGSYFVQTGNITLESGAMGGKGNGGDNNTDFES